MTSWPRYLPSSQPLSLLEGASPGSRERHAPRDADAKQGAGPKPCAKHTEKPGRSEVSIPRLPSVLLVGTGAPDGESCSGRTRATQRRRTAGEHHRCLGCQILFTPFLQWENYQSTPLVLNMAVPGEARTHAAAHPCGPPAAEQSCGAGELNLRTGGQQPLIAQRVPAGPFLQGSFVSAKGVVGPR